MADKKYAVPLASNGSTLKIRTKKKANTRRIKTLVTPTNKNFMISVSINIISRLVAQLARRNDASKSLLFAG